jgi:hypothetical protein
MFTTAKSPVVLLPAQNVDLTRWATIACDQFCAEPEYWDKLEKFVADAPSTLRLVLPEIRLNGHLDRQVREINAAMEDYLSRGLLEEREGMILVERSVSGGKKRIGLLLVLDLEDYDWKRVSVPIRATEDTIMSRLPARQEIRKGAAIELPHALVLIDDCKKEIIESLYARRDKMQKLYDFELNMGGGAIAGYAVPDAAETLAKLAALLDPSLQKSKYGWDAGILFAIGDGNHSFAAAKCLWEEIKAGLSPKEMQTHPARYILAEIVNIYGESMDFKPIHRFIKTPDPERFIRAMSESMEGGGTLTLMTPRGDRTIQVASDPAIAIKEIQTFLEQYARRGKAKIEYVHSTGHLREVVGHSGGVGICMPIFPSEKLFHYVVNVGNLPKKAFSVGEAEDKRYYLEARRIRTAEKKSL